MQDVVGILFDKDGTLFDFHHSWSKWATTTLLAYAQGDEILAARCAAAIGFDWKNKCFYPDSGAIAGTPAWIAAQLARATGRDAQATETFLLAQTESAEMVPATPLAPLLARLSERGLKLGVATNDGAVPARAHLAAHGVLGAFDFVAGCDSGHGAKPEPGMVLAFCRSIKADPSQVIMVGDSLHDLEAGRAAGAVAVGVLTGMAGPGDLLPHARAVLPSIAALPEWLSAGGPLGIWPQD